MGPAFGRTFIRCSLSSWRSASRMTVRETPSVSHRKFSTSRWPAPPTVQNLFADMLNHLLRSGAAVRSIKSCAWHLGSPGVPWCMRDPWCGASVKKSLIILLNA